MFRSLHLKNFKKHADLSVDFTTGMNGIYGPNYMGKSTLLYGLLFALGGTSHVPGTRLANRDSDGRYQVEAEFEVSGDLLRVVRTKSSANLYLNGAEEPIASGTTGVNDEIEKRIGMSVKQWKELHYAKQKNAHSLLRYSAGNLHSLMRRLVGAEELDQVQNRLKRMADKERGVLDALSESSGFTAEEANQAISDLQTKISAQQDAAKDTAELVQDLVSTEEVGVTKTQADNTKLQQLITAKGEAVTQQTRLEAAQRGMDLSLVEEADRRLQLAQADNALADLESTTSAWLAALTERIEQRVAALEKGIDPAAGEKIAQYEELTRRINLAAAAVPSATQRLEQAREALAAGQQTVDQATLAVQQAPAPDVAQILADQNAQADLRGEVTVINQRIKDLTSAIEGAACPTCQRPFEEHNPEELQGELDQAVATKQKLVTQGQALGEKITAAQGAATKASAAQRTLELAESQLQQQESTVIHEENQLLLAEQEQLKAQEAMAESGLDDDKVQALRNQSKNLADGRQWAATDLENGRTQAEQSLATARANAKLARSEWDKADAAHRAALDALAALEKKGKPGDVAAMEEQIAKLQERLKKDQTTLAELRTTLAQARQEELEANQQLALSRSQEKVWVERLQRLEAAAERRSKAETRLAKIQHLQKHLKTNAEGYMGKVWGSFLAQASGVVRQCTGGDMQGLQRNEDGAFEFLEEGCAMALDEASGAQEAIIGLAVQLALSTAAPCHLNVLLLDEPTADMDPDCSLATMVAMRALGQQVIFVSHHQHDNSLCDNAITL